MTRRHTHMSMVEIQICCPTAWRYTNRQDTCGVGFLMRLQTGPDTALVIQPRLPLPHCGTNAHPCSPKFFVREYQSDQSA